MRIAFVHDWLTGMRGGEKVLEALVSLWPDADVFTLVHARGSVSPAIEARRIRTSAIQRLPAATRVYRHYLPLFPAAIEMLDLDAYDLVISSSHCAAKAAVVPGRARHVCYCHSPMRYAWDQFAEYFGAERVGRAAEAAYRPVMAWLARWDAGTAPRVHRFLANSAFVASRIRRFYGRAASVVYPPVDTEFFQPGGEPAGDHLLVVSALVPYKRIDLAIAGCRAAGVPLRVAGDGPDQKRLERLAGPGVTFLGRLTDEQVRDEYRRARGVILPGAEDFGIVPVEAQACGRPVVALARGGALETVIDGQTGVLFERASAEALAEAVGRLASLRADAALLRAAAERFSKARFLERMRAAVDEALAAPLEERW
ncbi:MAG TPA: glycosyltransferase [Vicinamibacterales bacterium]|nr:glycosyltransferase [Vicinamibacterales bacterium]